MRIRTFVHAAAIAGTLIAVVSPVDAQGAAVTCQSAPFGGNPSFRCGPNSAAASPNATAVGNNAHANSSDTTAIGANSTKVSGGKSVSRVTFGVQF